MYWAEDPSQDFSLKGEYMRTGRTIVLYSSSLVDIFRVLDRKSLIRLKYALLAFNNRVRTSMSRLLSVGIVEPR